MRAFLQVEATTHGARVAYPDKTKPRKPQQRPFIIPFFIPQHGCPHRCAFCNQPTISGQQGATVGRKAFATAVERFLNYPHHARGHTQLAFFGGNFLGLPPEGVRNYLDWAAAYVHQGAVNSLRFSTRPDSISPQTLALIQDYPVRTVELGVQSMDDRVLELSLRGHCALDTTRAVRQLKRGGYEIGLQIMTGLPGDTAAGAVGTVEALMALDPGFVRIYPTLVLAGSPLAADYRDGRYRPATLDESVELVARLWLKLTAAGIPVVRMGLQDSPRLAGGPHRLAGPYHPAFGELVLSRIFLAMAAAGIERLPPGAEHIVLRVNPRRLSVMTGPHRQNRTTLRENFHLTTLQILADLRLAHNQLEVDSRQSCDASIP